MGGISQLKRLPMDELAGVAVFQMSRSARRGEEQTVLVVCDPGAKIPLHTHSVDAQMFIAGGSGTVLSDDPAINGQMARIGDLVFFKRGVAHGFQAADDGLSFVSCNGGTCDESGEWDINFTDSQRR